MLVVFFASPKTRVSQSAGPPTRSRHPLTESFFNDSIITDTLNWTLTHGSFIADSAYNYIVIGNFFDDNHTDTIKMGTGFFDDAYYYIDDICVSTDSLSCPGFVGINESAGGVKLILSPNPFSDKINITSKRNELLEVNLYDITSRKLLHQKFTHSASLNTASLAKGIYLYEIRNKNAVIKKGKVVKE